MLAGMDVARINFSHSRPQEALHRIHSIRALNSKYRRRIKLLGDLQGHRIRIGALATPIELKKHRTFWLCQQEGQGTPERISFDYRGLPERIKIGHKIFIDDGNIGLEVISRAGNKWRVKVLVGGLLKGRKGVNIPEADLDFGAISPRDVEDAHFCVENHMEYIAQSFVRTKKDILEVLEVLGKNSRCLVVAKIECRQGIRNIDEIIKVSDGIMIARGDMGVSLPIYEIPVIQKKIIKKCNRAGKFVITATQMLESMTENPRPTRAEVTDVANAVIDGTDFVMLSAESAVGKHPVESVAMMNNIIKFTENYLRTSGHDG
ncbi:MAG: pyruvate kinase [Candidatus Omnitrophica bacterium CG1_02_46_14]|nr:MAG: pyruvate kinase [Candidatus Omnitrophica bacterium CG1_02_46_14]